MVEADAATGAQPLESGRRAEDLETIRQSRLFDEAFYLASYRDVADSGVSPLLHFFEHGFREGRLPNAYFDPLWYLEQNSDVRGADMQPLLHYVRYGDAEGRRPGPFFDPAWYRETYQLRADENALAQYLTRVTTCTVSPIPEFDAVFYGERYTDVGAAGIDPFQHFLHHGFREGRNPSMEFDTRFYATRYCGGALETNPFLHYLVHKGEPGIFGRLPPEEATVGRELKRLTKPGQDFEEFSPLPEGAKPFVKALAFYLPQFHSFKENDEWWGKGFTEWSNICRGTPRFVGHYQPRIPRDLGFYTLDRLEPMLQQIAMAQAAGIHGFVFYHYWFNGKRLMEGPVERFLAAPEAAMPFCLMWANESWTRRWDGTESDVLIQQSYQPENDQDITAEFARHFADSRYIRVQGRPLLMIYRPGLIPDTAATIARWRVIFREQFGENPIITMAQSFNDHDPQRYGMDGAVEFPPHKVTNELRPRNLEYQLLDQEFEGRILNYDDVVAVSVNEPAPSFPLIKTAFPSWDNDARRQGQGVVVTGSSPQKYQHWLSSLAAKAVAAPFFGESFVCINAWNEWCEGAYLEPDLHYGSAYLNATARAISRTTAAGGAAKLLLIGHDAFPSGAQQLLLSIGRALQRKFGLQIAFLLLGPGRLEKAYADLAPLTVAANERQMKAAIAAAAANGFTRAIVNTSAAGQALVELAAAGIEAITLVHEMPRLIREKQLNEAARAVLTHSERIVFPAEFVRRQFLEIAGGTADDRSVILPQGVYKTIRSDRQAGGALRAALGLGPADLLVIGAGYADMRKGFDLFLQLWRLLQRPGARRVHVAWFGAIDPELNSWMSGEIEAARATGTFHMPGYQDDMDAVFNAADAFALTSREDPFPSVVLEALSIALDCFVFDRAGGIPDLLREMQTGTILPYADVPAMAEAIFSSLMTPARVSLRREEAAAKWNFSFDDYAGKLLALALPQLPRISVVVPNYNYARHLPDRLKSIFAQTHPVHEIIVLDDASADDSVSVVEEVAAAERRDVRVVAGTVNSGSVFAQWRKAAALAAGEFVWIAEADDLADPQFLEHTIAAMAADARIALAFCDSRAICQDGHPVFDSYKAYFATTAADALDESRVFEASNFVQRCLAVKNLILNGSGVLWRREALLAALDAAQAQLGSLRMAGDWLLYLTALQKAGARIAYIADVLNTHRRHEKSVTHSLAAIAHVAEVARCHGAAAEMFDLPPHVLLAQQQYLTELRAQFGLGAIVAWPAAGLDGPAESFVASAASAA